MLAAIAQKDRPLLAVAAFVCLAAQPLEERQVALERCVEPLVDRALNALGRWLKRIDTPNDRNLGVLRFLACCPPDPRAFLASPSPPCPRCSTCRRRRVRLPATLMLGLTNHGRAATVPLHEQQRSVVYRHCRLLQKSPGSCAHRIHHTKHSARTRGPFIDLPVRLSRHAERHLRHQARDARHDAQGETRAQGQLAVHEQIRCCAPIPNLPTHGPGKLHLAEPRPQVTDSPVVGR